jgi:hypothetical protein
MDGAEGQSKLSMGPRLRGDDAFKANSLKTVVLAKASTHAE